jgi:DNA-binding response OmpR family regulator
MAEKHEAIDGKGERPHISSGPTMPEPTKFILVIDDEHMVHEMIEAHLDKEGYDEVSVDAAKEGLRYFKKHHAEVDAVIVDLTLPEMSGIELAEKLREIKPELPVILITGDTSRSIPIDKQPLLHAILNKPFKKAQLMEVVKIAVGKPR